MSVTRADAARRWLTRADPDLDHAERWFAQTGIVLMPLGRQWDAVRVNGAIAEAVLDEGIEGPVIRDHEAVYFLVGLGTSLSWNAPHSEGLGVACYVTVPAPERTAGPGVHWAQAPDGNGQLVDAARLHALLTAAHTETAR
ncbi:hypothetical protein ACH429_06140 [Streptomyces pathocidini]|uniref:Uncharacterized protein n=1 Tax=Streptomyces pathocidini TaxID=1650571 RepID=A0ABW7UMM1_9ACTN|nr:hypothetical protein [Streptomyces pathocidini]